MVMMCEDWQACAHSVAWFITAYVHSEKCDLHILSEILKHLQRKYNRFFLLIPLARM